MCGGWIEGAIYYFSDYGIMQSDVEVVENGIYYYFGADGKLTWKDEKEYVEKDLYDRFIFGKPPVSNAEWLFISHMIKSLNSNGKGIAITSSGTLFRGSSEETIRKNILSLDCIEAVISLPGVMTITAIPINMMVINMNN